MNAIACLVCSLIKKEQLIIPLFFLTRQSVIMNDLFKFILTGFQFQKGCSGLTAFPTW